MRVVFLCNSQEPGRDGIGDYTRRLAVELTKMGHEASLISLHDRYIPKGKLETTIDGVPVLRLSAYETYKSKRKPAKEWIKKKQPHFISLQYVPYGFNDYGLPVALPSFVKHVSSNIKLHIMFHEIWTGGSKTDSRKEKLIGIVQKKITQQVLRQSGFDYVFANTSYYSSCIRQQHTPCRVMPIFNSLPLASGSALLYEQLPSHIRQHRDNIIIACFFGGIHYHTELSAKVMRLNAVINTLSKKLVVVHVGKGNPEPAFVQAFTNQSIEFIVLGEQPANDVADFFSHADIGLSTYPKILYQKSSSMASMLNNGLPVVLLRDGFQKDDTVINEVKEVEEIDSMKEFIYQDKAFAYQYSSDYTVKQYIQLGEIATGAKLV